MKALASGVAFVTFTTLCGLVLGLSFGGVREWSALVSLLVGLAAMSYSYFSTFEPAVVAKIEEAPSKRESKRAQRRRGVAVVSPEIPPARYPIWLWIAGLCFALFALRSFCWLLYVEGGKYRIQSPNNLGDLALHLTYLRYLAQGVPLWPENPIYLTGELRYPAGMDLFNALLFALHLDLVRGLVWTGLLASLATFYALYRWGGSFTVAGFLFNGGLAGYQFWHHFRILDYQGTSSIAWKSIPLSMFVTQRGLLYAIPAALLLLCHWREKFFAAPEHSGDDNRPKRILPFWLELSIYSAMPLFHVHTFLALSFVLAYWLITGTSAIRKEVALLLAAAFLPATAIVWMITDHFHAGSILGWEHGWVQSTGEFARPFFSFWLVNFGMTLPLALLLVGLLVWRMWKDHLSARVAAPFAFTIPAAALFLFACLVKTAPWEWDNIKLIIWSYLLVLPFFWSEILSKLQTPIRYALCFVLFASGAVSVAGGLAVGRPGFELADRSELDSLATELRRLPITARFAAYPTYNHPLLLNGRKLVLGYTGHLWTQGFVYGEIERQLTGLMKGAPNWKEVAAELHVRYLFWGRMEAANYPASRKPWEGSALRVAKGKWGAIYDLEQPAAAPAAQERK
jgi:hypothetical protein